MPVARHDLARRITLVLVFKAVALWALWYFFFSPAHRPVIDAGRVDEHLFPATTATATPESHDGT